MDDIKGVCERLEAAGQAHLIDAVRDHSVLREVCQGIDWEAMSSLVDRLVRVSPESQVGALEPASCVTTDSSKASGDVELVDGDHLSMIGEEAIASGRVAVFTVAGGQGTRLGWSGPKGSFPASPVVGKPLFRLFAEQILAAQKRYGVTIRWYIMTSAANDAATRAFLLDNRCFGLDRRHIMLFPQGMMPAFDKESGEVLMDSPSSLAMSPDGHGGAYAALRRSGAIDQMEGRGIDMLAWHQVDNPLAVLLDPTFIGLHVEASHSSGQFSSKMTPKSSPEERVGIFAKRDGRTSVVEYSDLTKEETYAEDGQGRLRFMAGNIATHLISVAFAKKVADSGEQMLPWHRAEKSVPFFDPKKGIRVESPTLNAVKLERFVFDAMGEASQPVILQVDRERHFAPIKNAEGQDSPASSKRMQSDLYGSWLDSAGVQIPRDGDGHVDADIEISPLTAMSSAEIKEADLPASIPSGGSFSC